MYIRSHESFYVHFNCPLDKYKFLGHLCQVFNCDLDVILELNDVALSFGR
jgi:hypothetical protein